MVKQFLQHSFDGARLSRQQQLCWTTVLKAAVLYCCASRHTYIRIDYPLRAANESMVDHEHRISSWHLFLSNDPDVPQDASLYRASWPA